VQPSRWRTPACAANLGRLVIAIASRLFSRGRVLVLCRA
jgi:hypothetical protein